MRGSFSGRIQNISDIILHTNSVCENSNQQMKSRMKLQDFENEESLIRLLVTSKEGTTGPKEGYLEYH